MGNQTPAGWYPDPSDSTRAQTRYWDGVRWTEHVATPAAPTAPPSPQPLPPPALVAAPTLPTPPPQVVAQAVHVPSMPAAKQHGVFGGKKGLEEENAQLRALLDSFGISQRDALRAEIAELDACVVNARRTVAELESQVVRTSDEMVLQEVGIYTYSHPLETSIEYKAWLDQQREYIKGLVKAGRAVTAISSWTVNGSTKEGAKMVADISKLMLRAYVAEADNCVRTVKPVNRDSTVLRLSKTRETIAKLGQVMQIRISDELHQARVQEVTTTADFIAKKETERERERDERAQLREEEHVAREIAAAQAKLEKERQQYATALAQLVAKGDHAGAAELQAKLSEIDDGLAGLAERAANTRAGHVYVISNIGSFGERMVKIGMTRRLEPMDRVRELGDASVPFRYDVHALFFSDDAVGLESALHQRFAAQRVNMVNAHREFFHVTAHEVKEALAQLNGHVLEYTELPEAVEYHQSVNERHRLFGR
jgi:hypothetical protein